MVGETATRELLGQFPNQIIRASAGTGKTFALSNRYLQLLASGAECQTILATTFTKKGAGEILDRIIARLSDAALDDAAAEKLSGELDWKLSRDRAAKILHELLGNLHRLEISTLDSFFNKVAKAFALELGLPPTWDIVDEQQINRMQDEAIQSVLRNSSVINLLHMLSKGQAARRVATMVRDTVEQIYGIYRESGAEPWDKLDITGKFIPDDQLELLIDRMEAVELTGKMLPKHWNEVLGYAKVHDWAAFASNTSFQRSLDGDYKYNRTKLPAEIVEIYKLMIPHCTAYVESRLIQQNKSTSELLSKFGELLEKRKDETGNLRFDDVTERLVHFVSMWDTDRFSFRLDHQIQHLLLDEFQDTSLAQWQVIRPFAKNVTEDAETLRSFFCVGDMKQAIFGWRGGVAEIFDLVDNELPNLAESKQLAASYRSSQNIIDLVNDVFLNVEKYNCGSPMIDEAIQQWPAWFTAHTTERKELKGHVTIEMAADCEQQQKRFEETKDRIRNDNVIYKTVQRVKKLARELPDHHSIGVIVRTNAEVSNLIFKLQQAGIDASEEGGSPLSDSAAVEIILSAIKLADHPGDSVARFHVSHSPLGASFGLEPETDLNQKQNIAAAQVAAAKLRSRLVSEGYGPTIESLSRQLIDHCTKRELQRLQHIVRIAYDAQSDNEQWQLRPSRFVQYVREEVKVSDLSSARVRVMTIHKCKGLEFDAVVLPLKLRTQGWAGFTPNVVVGRDSPTDPINIATRYMGEKLRKLLPQEFQTIFEQDRQSNVRESMCVLYVALTRAVHATHIILSHGAKPDHKSASGILLATLCPQAEREEGVLYETGDPHWHKFTESVESTDPFSLSDFYLTESIDLPVNVVPKDIRSGRGIPQASPSRMEGGDEMRLGEIFEAHDNLGAITRGTMLHGCFQAVNWIDESVPKKEQLESHLKKLDPTMQNFDRFIAEFYGMTDHDNIRKLLSRSTYQETYMMEFAQPGEVVMEANRLEVHNERRFAVQLNGELLEGVIDRLVLVYQGNRLTGADIIDFKTDAADGLNLQQLIGHYRPQMSAYRDAVSRFLRLPIEKISTRLVFVSSGQVINLNLVETSIETPAKPTAKSRQRHAATQTVPKPKDVVASAAKPKEVVSSDEPPAKRGEKIVPDPKSKPASKKVRQQTLWSDD
ncbi:MAG: UvrD-helicase domain-containing protein [Mariniblastus sp.]